MPLHPFLPELCEHPALASCILSAMPLLQGKSFLEIGCGNGYFCGYALSRYACPVVGLDSDEHRLTEARRNFPGCDFRSTDVLPGARFDVVLARDAMFADPDIFQTRLHKLTAHLRPGGMLLLATPLAPPQSMVDDHKLHSPSHPNFRSGLSVSRVSLNTEETDAPSYRELARCLSAYTWRTAGTGDGWAILCLRHRQSEMLMSPVVRASALQSVSA